jgi:hypothetical protein
VEAATASVEFATQITAEFINVEHAGDPAVAAKVAPEDVKGVRGQQAPCA